MATKPKQPGATPVDTRDPTGEQPADGCVWMFKDGQRAEVEAERGSVEIMAELGWSTTPPG